MRVGLHFLSASKRYCTVASILRCIALRIRSKLRSMVGRFEPVHCIVKSELEFGRTFLRTTRIKIGKWVVAFQRNSRSGGGRRRLGNRECYTRAGASNA